MTHIFTKSILTKVLLVSTICLLVSLNINAKGPKTSNTEEVTTSNAVTLKPVRGFVVDEFGEPMVGVLVDALGSAKSTITNTEGKYSLLANSNDVLKFSQIGSVSKEEKITSSRIVNVELAIE